MKIANKMARLDPTVILPIYRSPTTTDWTRIVLSCIVHPLLQEFVMTVQRSGAGDDKKELEVIINNPDMHYHALGNMGTAFYLETVLVMQRRSMLGCMIDPTATIVAIVLTALEEAILRSTMVYRDQFFDKLTGRRKPTEAELRHKVRVVWCSRPSCLAFDERSES